MSAEAHAARMRVVVAGPEDARAEIAAWLGGVDACEIVGRAASGDEALATVAKAAPDLLVVHLDLAGASALAVIEQLWARGLRTGAVLVMPAGADPAIERRALRSGALEVLRAPLDGTAAAAVREAVVEARRRHELFARVTPPASPAGVALGATIAVVSAKGGVGRSFVAANLASLLAESASTALCDLDLQFGDISSWGTERAPERTIDQLVAVVDAGEVTREDVRAVAQTRFGKVTLVPGSRSPLDGAVWASERGVRALRLVQALRGWFRYVVVDSLPGLLEPIVGVGRGAQLVVVVTTCEAGALRATKRYLELLDRYVPVPRLVVANRSNRGERRALVQAALGASERIRFIKEDRTFARRLVVEGLAAAQQPGRGVSRSFRALAADVTSIAGRSG